MQLQVRTTSFSSAGATRDDESVRALFDHGMRIRLRAFSALHLIRMGTVPLKQRHECRLAIVHLFLASMVSQNITSSSSSKSFRLAIAYSQVKSAVRSGCT